MAVFARAALVAAAFIAFTAPSTADDTGLASMHAWKKVGKLTCYAEHTHYGTSAGHRDKKAAMAEAAKSWASFTAFEYGTDWANFNKATAKKFSCNQTSGGWGCEVEARPCR